MSTATAHPFVTDEESEQTAAIARQADSYRKILEMIAREVGQLVDELDTVTAETEARRQPAYGDFFEDYEGTGVAQASHVMQTIGELADELRLKIQTKV